MNNWEDFQRDDDQKKWSEWSIKTRQQSPSVTNFVSAFLISLAAIVVMSGNVA